MKPGTYTLLLELEAPRTVQFGAAGTRDLAVGFYAYTGSAFGPGGLSRVDRHRQVATGANDTRHWHVDHLLGNDAVTFLDTWLGPEQDAECAVVGRLEGTPISGLGASDCDCDTHLVYSPTKAPLVDSLDRVYDRLRR